MAAATMYGLSVRQPWASLLALNVKCVETRPMLTHYRGLLAIHASKATSAEQEQLAIKMQRHLYGASFAALPRGAIIAVGRIIGCIPTEQFRPGGLERQLGNYKPGRWAWVLGEVNRLDRPISHKGQLGLFPLGSDVVRQVMDAAWFPIRHAGAAIGDAIV